MLSEAILQSFGQNLRESAQNVKDELIIRYSWEEVKSVIQLLLTVLFAFVLEIPISPRNKNT